VVGLYLAAAIIGVPLVAYFAIAGEGDDMDTDVDVDADVDGGGIFSISLATGAFFTAFFGVGGLAIDAVGAGTLVTLLMALIIGAVAAGIQMALWRYVRTSSRSSEVGATELTGRPAEVVLPIGPGRRGRISLVAGGQRLYVSAEALEGDLAEGMLERGQPVVVVAVERGVATVSRLDAELA
jgi:membrane protein implicated in regulation of membrane protease activity